MLYRKLVLKDGIVYMDLLKRQGNVIVSSTIGSNLIAIIPAGSDALPKGARLKGFLI